MIYVYSHLYSPLVRKRVDCYCVQFPYGLQCVPLIHLVAPVYVSMQPVHLLRCVCVSPHWPWIHLHYFACALSHMCARLASRLMGSTWHLSAVSLWSCVCIFAAWLSLHHVLRFSCNLHDLLATVGRYRISYGCDFSCDVQFVVVLFCVPAHLQAVHAELGLPELSHLHLILPLLPWTMYNVAWKYFCLWVWCFLMRQTDPLQHDIVSGLCVLFVNIIAESHLPRMQHKRANDCSGVLLKMKVRSWLWG